MACDRAIVLLENLGRLTHTPPISNRRTFGLDGEPMIGLVGAEDLSDRPFQGITVEVAG